MQDTARKTWLSCLAQADPARLTELVAALDLPEPEVLRAPQSGSVMLQGRVSGTGAPFSFGEMTVTRCSLRLPCGTVGHGYVQGRDRDAARAAALADALLQTGRAEELRTAVLAPLEAEAAARKAARARNAAATRVEFFTLVRGED